jgi:hypothetical protein
MFPPARKSKSGILLVIGIFLLGAAVLGGLFYARHVIRRAPPTSAIAE